jgi:Zn-dependent peptidase ImmA (M78 family)
MKMVRLDIQSKANEILIGNDCYKVPVDVKTLAQRLGVQILEDDLPEDISAALDVRKKPVIFINSAHGLYRRRFSIAHELGHFVLHHPAGIIHVDKRTFFRNTQSSEGIEITEIEANKFAAALLMPAAFVREQLEQYEDFIDIEEDNDAVMKLAKFFQVSPTAMSFRMQNLGYSWLA